MRISNLELSSSVYTNFLSENTIESSQIAHSKKRFHKSIYAIAFPVEQGTAVISGKKNRIYFLRKKDAFFLKGGVRVPKILVDEGILTESEPTAYEEMKARLEKLTYFNDLYINLTDACNLACTYCYSSHGKNMLSYAVIKSALDYLKNNDYHPLSLFFLSGGEHTVAFPLLKKTIKYARTLFPEIEIELVTNGTFPTNSARWLAQNIDLFFVSCDGPPEIQNAMRPFAGGHPSSAIVEKNIRNLVKLNSQFCVNATFSPISEGKEMKIMRYFFELGVQNVRLICYAKQGRAKESDFLRAFPRNVLMPAIVKATELGHELGIHAHFDLPGMLARNSVNMCGFTGSSFVLNSEGQVNMCMCFANSKDLAKKPYSDMHIGSYSTNLHSFSIDFSKIKKLRDYVMHVKKCRSCEFAAYCYGSCPPSNYEITGNPYKPCKQNCAEFRTRKRFLVNFLTKRYLIKKYPCIVAKNNRKFYCLLYSEFELVPSSNACSMQKNPDITIDCLARLRAISKQIVAYSRKSKNLVFFLLRFVIEDKDITKEKGIRIKAFLSYLLKNHVYFRVAHPLPKCMFNNYDVMCSEFNVPANQKMALDLFTVQQNNALFFKNRIKSKMKLNDYFDREDIYSEYAKSAKSATDLLTKCTSCIYLLRKECEGICMNTSITNIY